MDLPNPLVLSTMCKTHLQLIEASENDGMERLKCCTQWRPMTEATASSDIRRKPYQPGKREQGVQERYPRRVRGGGGGA